MGKSSWRISIKSLSVGWSRIAVNPYGAFCSARVRLDGLVADIVVRVLKLTCYVEEHRILGDSIITRLYNGAFVGLIYSLLVFS